MTLQGMLEKYCLARSMHLHQEQVGLANALVDEYIPALIEQLSQTMIERNDARTKHESLLARQ